MSALLFARPRVALIVPLMAFGLFVGSPPALAQQSGDTNNCASADNSNDPCFSNVSDILQGERSLLPVDDMVVSYGTPRGDGSGNANVNNVLLPTENSDIDYPNVVQYAINPDTPAFATGVGRMWNLLRDVVVTATPGVVNVRIQAPTSITKGFPLAQTPVQNGLTMADFNGDGFDDFVIAMTNQSGGGFFQFVTAKDVNDLNQGLVEGPGVPGPAITGAGSITSGDLDGDGIPEVIVAYPIPSSGAAEVIVYRFSRDDSTLQQVGATTVSPFSTQPIR